MPIILPFLFFLLLVTLIKRKFPSVLWREAVLISFLGYGCLVFASAEILSLFNLFQFLPLCVFWGVGVLVLCILHRRAALHKISRNVLCGHSLSSAETLLLKCIALLVVFLGALALIMPPNTWDAMTYHMARVAHWVQNGTVGPYPTNIQRQLMFNPFAEYWIAHFQILSRGDYFANSVQFLSMLGSLVGISLVAKELGLARLGQILTVFLVITLPVAIVESTSTQTDFVVTLWCAIVVYFILKNIRRLQWGNTWAIAIAGGLAFYTKGVCFFIIVPFLGWMIWDGVKAKRRIGPHALLIGIVIAGFLGLFFLKNYISSGGFIFSGVGRQLLPLNCIKGIVSNVLLHFGMHLKLGIPQVDGFLLGALEGLHRFMGTTIMTSPANMGNYPFNYTKYPFSEDIVPNLLFFVFYMYWGIHFIIFRNKEINALKGRFFLISFLSFFIFNCFIKWAPFDGRYHLPFFVLFAPFLANALCARKLLVPVTVLFFIAAVPFLLFNTSKPLISRTNILTVPREMKYFYNRPDLLGPIRSLTQKIAHSGCKDVGLAMGEDSWEYPLWVYLHAMDRQVRIEHVAINNTSKQIPYPLGKFSPCQVITF